MHLWTILRLLYFYKQSFRNSRFLWPIKMANYSNVHHWQKYQNPGMCGAKLRFLFVCGHSFFNKMNFCSKISCFLQLLDKGILISMSWLNRHFPQNVFFSVCFCGFYYSIDVSERTFVRIDKSYPYIIHYIYAPKVSK